MKVDIWDTKTKTMLSVEGVDARAMLAADPERYLTKAGYRALHGAVPSVDPPKEGFKGLEAKVAELGEAFNALREASATPAPELDKKVETLTKAFREDTTAFNKKLDDLIRRVAKLENPLLKNK